MNRGRDYCFKMTTAVDRVEDSCTGVKTATATILTLLAILNSLRPVALSLTVTRALPPRWSTTVADATSTDLRSLITNQSITSVPALGAGNKNV